MPDSRLRRPVLALNDYHLVSNWRVLGTVDEVYEIVSQTRDFARWWPAAFLEVLELQPGDERGIDRVDRFETRGWLPFTLLWHSNVIEAQRPFGFKIEVWGDFEGTGEWRFEQNGAWTDASFDWRVRVNKPRLGFLSPLFKPLLTSNQRWAMAKGEESLRLELAKRHAASETERSGLPAPPAPASFPTIPLLIGVGALIGVVLWRRSHR